MSSQSSTPCGRCKVLRDQLYTVGDERDRAVETRENANAVSVRVEAENRWLREALQTAQGEAYLGALDGDDTPDALAACHNVINVCQEALS